VEMEATAGFDEMTAVAVLGAPDVFEAAGLGAGADLAFW
jgi:hypothetical protein